MSAIKESDLNKEITWTPSLIKSLRGKRTLVEFGKMIGVPKNTVWRWEAGYAEPRPDHARRLSSVAESERFLEDWQLVGSMILADDIEAASRKISAGLRKSVARAARSLASK